MITLRDYQADGIAKIREAFAAGYRAPLYVCPTGAGKTTVFAAIAQSSETRGKRVLILCHRVELVDQIVSRLREFGVKPDIIAASYTRFAGPRQHAYAVTVASVQTLIRRLDHYAEPTLIIADEAHHFSAGNTFSQITTKYRGARLLGVTATPCRTSGEGLGCTFDTLVIGPSEESLIAAGHLVRTRIYGPPTVDTSGLHTRMGDFKTDEAEALVDKPSVTGDALAQYQKHTPDEQGLVFCTSVAHAHHVAEQFRKGGVSALALNGGMDKQIRRMAFDDYRAGKIRVLTSADIFSEGVDCPGARVGIMLRPTQSLIMYRQQKGRLSRTAPGKAYATLLDHVQNATRPGFELLPGETDQWTLHGDADRRVKKPAPGIRVCPKCFAASQARANRCAECGEPFPTKARAEIDERDGDLVELTAEEIQRKRERREVGRSRTLAELQAFARLKGYKDNWATHVWAARQKKEANRGKETEGSTVAADADGSDL